jgi:transmembrane 9 superfamily protein 2/4
MLEDTECRKLCTTAPIPKEDAEFITERVKENYAINWLIDGLPAARNAKDDRAEGDEREFYGIGFELGYAEKSYMNTHYSIEIKYHAREDDNYRVVGVVVRPVSRDTKEENGQISCAPTGTGPYQFKYDDKDTITYTYSVTWIVSIHYISHLGALANKRSVTVLILLYFA